MPSIKTAALKGVGVFRRSAGLGAGAEHRWRPPYLCARSACVAARYRQEQCPVSRHYSPHSAAPCAPATRSREPKTWRVPPKGALSEYFLQDSWGAELHLSGSQGRRESILSRNRYGYGQGPVTCHDACGKRCVLNLLGRSKDACVDNHGCAGEVV